MCHAGVVAPTVQKLIDVEIMWKIDGAGKFFAGITAVKMKNSRIFQDLV